MKKTGILIIILLAIALVVGLTRTKQEVVQSDEVTTQTPPAGKLVTGSELETFSGTVTAVDTGCFADAICSVTVDGKKVIIVTGGRMMAGETNVGKLLGAESIGDIKVGQHANVYAAPTPEGEYTLYGNTNYYVEITN
jgi:hypothetical protein